MFRSAMFPSFARALPCSLAVLLCLVAGSSALAGEDREREGERGELERLERIIQGLGSGLEALHALGGHEEVFEHLSKIRNQLKERFQEQAAGRREKKAGKDRGKTERQVAEEQLELMHLAHRVLSEAGRGNCAEVMERAIHALKLALEGRRDEEAMHVRKTAPSRAEKAECAGLAAEILAERGEKRPAGWLAKLAKQFRGRAAKGNRGEREARRAREEREHAEREREEREHAERERREREHEEALHERRDRGPRERMHHHLEIMEAAKHALLEADRHELAHQLELAMHWRALHLEGHDGPDARRVRSRAPTPVNLGEILIRAGRIWARLGHEHKAELCHELGEHFVGQAVPRDWEPWQPGADGIRRLREATEQMQESLRRVRELQEALRHAREEMEREREK